MRSNIIDTGCRSMYRYTLCRLTLTVHGANKRPRRAKLCVCVCVRLPHRHTRHNPHRPRTLCSDPALSSSRRYNLLRYPPFLTQEVRTVLNIWNEISTQNAKLQRQVRQHCPPLPVRE